jgi:hypothetical protein
MAWNEAWYMDENIVPSDGTAEDVCELGYGEPAAADFSTEVDDTRVVVPPLSSRTKISESHLLVCSSNSKTGGAEADERKRVQEFSDHREEETVIRALRAGCSYYGDSCHLKPVDF